MNADRMHKKVLITIITISSPCLFKRLLASLRIECTGTAGAWPAISAIEVSREAAPGQITWVDSFHSLYLFGNRRKRRDRVSEREWGYSNLYAVLALRPLTTRARENRPLFSSGQCLMANRSALRARGKEHIPSCTRVWGGSIDWGL